MDEKEIVISAAFDGERVDIETLRQVLATREGQGLLASFVQIRAEVAADGITPGRPLSIEEIESCSLTQAIKLQTKARNHISTVAGMRIPLSVTAVCVVMVALAASFWLGSVWKAGSQPGMAIERPLPVSATAEREKTGAAHSVDTGIIAADPRAVTSDVPKPTRVLRYVPGREWRPKS